MVRTVTGEQAEKLRGALVFLISQGVFDTDKEEKKSAQSLSEKLGRIQKYRTTYEDLILGEEEDSIFEKLCIGIWGSPELEDRLEEIGRRREDRRKIGGLAPEDVAESEELVRDIVRRTQEAREESIFKSPGEERRFWRSSDA